MVLLEDETHLLNGSLDADFGTSVSPAWEVQASPLHAFRGGDAKLAIASALVLKILKSRPIPLASRTAFAPGDTAASLTSPFRFMASSRQQSIR